MKKLSIRKKILALLISGNIMLTGCSISGKITEKTEQNSVESSYTQSSTLDNNSKFESSNEESLTIESSLSEINNQASLESSYTSVESSVEESSEIVDSSNTKEESYDIIDEISKEETNELDEESTNEEISEVESSIYEESDENSYIEESSYEEISDTSIEEVSELKTSIDENSDEDNYIEESSKEYDDSNEIYTDDDSYIRAIDYVNVRTIPNSNSDILDLLYPGDTLKKLGYIDEYYIVDYKGNKAYVAYDYTEEIAELEESEDNTEAKELDNNLNISDICYFPNGSTLYSDAHLTNEILNIPSLESAEIYYQEGNAYYVETDGNKGYVSKSSASIIPQPAVVVDESDQILKLYKDNNKMMEFPVVTGNYPDYASTKGLFSIFSKSYNANLVGPTWDVYVNVFMGYTVYGEGIHDAVWRDYYEFGGTTYQGNGSHGCVNCRYDDVMALADEVEVGDKVLVKR